MRRSVFAASALLAGTVGIFVMFGAERFASAQSTGPCAEDMKKHCSDVTKGGGRLLRCYEERKDRMSAGCTAWVELAKSNAEILRQACAKEINSSCNREKGDPLEMLDCLQGNYVDLSVGCREKLNAFKGMYPLPVQ